VRRFERRWSRQLVGQRRREALTESRSLPGLALHCLKIVMRQVINAILYLVGGGIQWRMLPKEYPKWQSV
jgi:transposase